MNIEQKMKNENRTLKVSIACCILFFVILAAGCVLGLFCYGLRPEESILEKRKLTEFPKFTIESFLDGSYTSEIETWFADTFPGREKLVTAEQRMKNLYGFRKNSVEHVAEGDDVPDIDDLLESLDEESESPEEPSEPATSAAETSSTAETDETESSESASESSETETESETEETVDAQELIVMNPQEAGEVNVKDYVGYCVYGFNRKGADKYCENVAAVAEKVKASGTKVYDILIPNNSAITLDEKTKDKWKLLDERKVIQYYQAMMKKLSSDITHVNIYNTLAKHSDEYLYFRTDHHWTQLGAYYAYEEFCKAAGLKAHKLTDYEEIIEENFLGSYYSTNGKTQLEDHPDTVTAYVPIATNELSFFDTSLNTMRSGKIIRDLGGDEFLPTQRYLSFIYGDNPYSIIENPTLQDGSCCIVVKESFGNTFVPFLVDHYQKVIVIDYRAYKDSLVELAETEKATDIVFINNLEAISDKSIMDVMGNICK